MLLAQLGSTNSISLRRLGAARLPLDPRVHVLGVLAEDHDVEVLRSHAPATARRRRSARGGRTRTDRAAAAGPRSGCGSRRPTGVVSGPLIATLYSRTASTVASGSHSPNRRWLSRRRRPRTRRSSASAAVRPLDRGVEDVARGGPDVGTDAVPSTNGMIGRSGTTIRPSSNRIRSPSGVGIDGAATGILLRSSGVDIR